MVVPDVPVRARVPESVVLLVIKPYCDKEVSKEPKPVVLDRSPVMTACAIGVAAKKSIPVLLTSNLLVLLPS